jgi:replicative DNA helicase
MKTFRPENREAECAALGCALRGDDAAHALVTIPEEYFTTGKYRALHFAIKESLARQEGVNPVILRETLLKARWWDDNGDGQAEKVTMDFLSDLQDQAPPPSQIKAYIRLMKNAYHQRRILQEARKIEDLAGNEFLSDEDLNALEDAWQESAFAVSMNQQDRGGLKPVKAVITETFASIEARHNRTKAPYGIATGLSKLDALTTGLHPGELIIIAGRPGQGKTSFALEIATNAVRQTPTALFSLEMSAEQVGQRLLAKEARVNLRRIRAGYLEKYHFNALVSAMGDLSDYPLFVDDSATLTPAQIRFRVRNISVKSKNPIGLLIVDYLQIMSPGRRYDNREREISSLSREMKQLAKDLNCPVVLLSQLNRELEKRADKRPTLADLRESGAIEQDADVVIGLYQPFTYSNKREDHGKAQAIILKQRNGPVGSVDLLWTPETATFWNP